MCSSDLQRLFFRFEGMAEHTNPLYCQNQLDEVKKGLSQADERPLVVYCGKYGDKKFRLGVFMLSSQIYGLGNIRVVEDPKTFASYEVCRQELPKVIEFYKTQLHKNVLTGLCVDPDSKFRATLFEDVSPQTTAH